MKIKTVWLLSFLSYATNEPNKHPLQNIRCNFARVSVATDVLQQIRTRFIRLFLCDALQKKRSSRIILTIQRR